MLDYSHTVPVPDLEALGIESFLILNYFNRNEDLVRFRVYGEPNELAKTRVFLARLREERRIVRYEETDWDPRTDAVNRISDAGKKFHVDWADWTLLGGQENDVMTKGDYVAKLDQLTMMFAHVVGQCTKVLYGKMDSKPQDIWVMSVFLHLVLNSLSFSGPDAPSEETSIRRCPPY